MNLENVSFHSASKIIDIFNDAIMRIIKINRPTAVITFILVAIIILMNSGRDNVHLDFKDYGLNINRFIIGAPTFHEHIFSYKFSDVSKHEPLPYNIFYLWSFLLNFLNIFLVYFGIKGIILIYKTIDKKWYLPLIIGSFFPLILSLLHDLYKSLMHKHITLEALSSIFKFNSELWANEFKLYSIVTFVFIVIFYLLFIAKATILKICISHRNAIENIPDGGKKNAVL